MYLQGVVEKIFGIVENVDFSYVGHRVVHGGEMFKEATVMDEENIIKLSAISILAPCTTLCRQRSSDSARTGKSLHSVKLA